MKRPSVWDILFKRNLAPTAVEKPPFTGADTATVAVDGDWLSLTDPDFDGPAALSASKRWAVGYQEPVGSVGKKTRANGRVVLVDIEQQRVMHELTSFRRPMNAAVSNTGLYVVHDTGFGPELQADLIVVASSGELVARRRYQANMFNLGISPCGRYVTAQMANAPNGPDGGRLELLDIQTHKRLFAVLPITGWADHYSFAVTTDGQLQFLCVHFKSLGSFRYGPDGTFIDRDAFDDRRLTAGDFGQRILAAKDILKSGSPESASKVLQAIESALVSGARENPDWAAQAHRTQGEAHELVGQLPEALVAYKKALAINPKIGVRKKAGAIERKLKDNRNGA